MDIGKCAELAPVNVQIMVIPTSFVEYGNCIENKTPIKFIKFIQNDFHGKFTRKTQLNTYLSSNAIASEFPVYVSNSISARGYELQ